MTRKLLWLVVSSLMALFTVMAACAPPATTTTPPVTTPLTTAPPTTTPPVTAPPVVQPPQTQPAPTADVPQYGGPLRLALTADITNFDDVVTRGFTQGTTFLQTNESILELAGLSLVEDFQASALETRIVAFQVAVKCLPCCLDQRK